MAVVFVARKSETQSFVTVEDFWGGMVTGFLVGYAGVAFFQSLTGVTVGNGASGIGPIAHPSCPLHEAPARRESFCRARGCVSRGVSGSRRPRLAVNVRIPRKCLHRPSPRARARRLSGLCPIHGGSAKGGKPSPRLALPGVECKRWRKPLPRLPPIVSPSRIRRERPGVRLAWKTWFYSGDRARSAQSRMAYSPRSVPSPRGDRARPSFDLSSWRMLTSPSTKPRTRPGC